MLEKIEDKINKHKKDLKVAIKAKKTFFMEILRHGKDVRTEGISWIIRALNNMGEKVDDKDLPEWLDQTAKNFLITKKRLMGDIEEWKVLLDTQLEIYKVTLKNVKNQANDDYSCLKAESNIGGDSMNDSIVHDISMIPSQIKKEFKDLNVSLGSIDVSKILNEKTQIKKNNKVYNITKLVDLLPNEDKMIVEKCLDQLNQTKVTSNDVIYQETQKKIKLQIKAESKNTSRTIKSNEQSQNANSPSKQAAINELLEDESKDQIDPFYKSVMDNKLVLYENDKLLNSYDTRESFIQEYKGLEKKIKDRIQFIKVLEDQEASRMVTEFDFKNYEKKNNISAGSVFCALFGAEKADREMIRNGMKRS